MQYHFPPTTYRKLVQNKCKFPLNTEEIGNKYIYDNTHTRLNNKPLDYLQFKIPQITAEDVQVKHLMDNTGTFSKLRKKSSGT